MNKKYEELPLELKIKFHEQKIQMYKNKIDKEINILVDLERRRDQVEDDK